MFWNRRYKVLQNKQKFNSWRLISWLHLRSETFFFFFFFLFWEAHFFMLLVWENQSFGKWLIKANYFDFHVVYMIKDDLIYNLRDFKLAGISRRILLDAQTKLARKLNLGGIMRTVTRRKEHWHMSLPTWNYTHCIVSLPFERVIINIIC